MCGQAADFRGIVRGEEPQSLICVKRARVGECVHLKSEMQFAPSSAEEMLGFAVEAISRSEPAWREALDALPVPVYTADADGRVSYFNRACIAFAGRTPVAGEDMWGVT